MSFKDLKKQSQLGVLAEKLTNALNEKSYKTDDRLWKPQMDKSGTGYAVIRFLPAPEGEEKPFAKVYKHGFQGPGGWYIQNCLTTLGQSDPVVEHNKTLVQKYAEGDYQAFLKVAPSSVVAAVKNQNRQTKYYSNILVIKDPVNPENEGKHFIYEYGPAIFKKIAAAMKPEFEDEEAIDPFDLWKGANFKLKIVKKGGYWNYDNSEFDSPSELFGGDDDALEALYEKLYSLEAFTAPSEFETYENLKNRLNAVLGLSSESTVEKQEDELNEIMNNSERSSVTEELETAYQNSVSDDDDDDDEEVDEALKDFESLLNN